MAEFKSPQLAAKYEIVGGDQQIICRKEGMKHNGLLSDISDENVIKKMIENNSALVRAKTPPPAPAANGTGKDK